MRRNHGKEHPIVGQHEARRFADDDGLNVGQVEALVGFGKARGIHQQQMVGTEPQGVAAEDTAEVAGKLAIITWGHWCSTPLRNW